ncbi:MAG: hypothetical protein H0T62_00155 [Parachlamydiaceae bacterium]|nr:hypothetical protein [Parachlamydiaceae bacterium]
MEISSSNYVSLKLIEIPEKLSDITFKDSVYLFLELFGMGLNNFLAE